MSPSAAAPHAPPSLVCIVDDDLSVREALSSLLRSAGLAVQCWASASEFLAQAPAVPTVPTCLVLDVNMPGMSGLDLQRALARRTVPMPIVFITGHGDIPMTVRAMKAGAVEFLPKPFSDQELLEAIAEALARSRAAQEQLAGRLQVLARLDTLTPREREVMGWMVQGLRNKLTADRMGISEVTVKVHRHHVMEKMQVASVPELMAALDLAGEARAPLPLAAARS